METDGSEEYRAEAGKHRIGEEEKEHDCDDEAGEDVPEYAAEVEVAEEELNDSYEEFVSGACARLAEESKNALWNFNQACQEDEPQR